MTQNRLGCWDRDLKRQDLGGFCSAKLLIVANCCVFSEKYARRMVGREIADMKISAANLRSAQRL